MSVVVDVDVDAMQSVDDGVEFVIERVFDVVIGNEQDIGFLPSER